MVGFSITLCFVKSNLFPANNFSRISENRQNKLILMFEHLSSLLHPRLKSTVLLREHWMIYRRPGFLARSYDPASAPSPTPFTSASLSFSAFLFVAGPRNQFRKPYAAWRPATTILHRLVQSIPWNRFLGCLNVYKFGLCILWALRFEGEAQRSHLLLLS